MNRPPLRWAIVIVGLDPAAGHEQAGTRRVLVVSAEPFHRSGLMTVCPISARRAEARYPGEVSIPRGQAGQTEDAVILCQQVRTISIERIRAADVGAGSGIGCVTDRDIRARVREALGHHLGLDIPTVIDGAA